MEKVILGRNFSRILWGYSADLLLSHFYWVSCWCVVLCFPKVLLLLRLHGDLTFPEFFHDGGPCLVETSPLIRKVSIWGHPFSTYAIFCKKMTPSPPIRTRTFCNTPPPPLRTYLLVIPPIPLLLCKIEFFVQNFIRFRDPAYYILKDHTLFNFFFALFIFTTMFSK